MPPLAALASAPAFLLAICLGGQWSMAVKPAWCISFVTALAVLGRMLAISMGSSGLLISRGAVLCEAILAIVLALVFARGLPILRRGLLPSGGNEDLLFLTLIPLALAVVGLVRMHIHGLNLGAIAAAFAVILAGYLGGPGLGAGMGALLSLAPGLGYGPWPLPGGLALGGLFAGLLRHSGRLGMLFGFSAGFALPLVSQAMQGPLSWPTAGQALLGMGAFLALPNDSLNHLGRALPTDHSWAAAKRSEQSRLRGLLSDRVQELALIFAQLSKAFVAKDREREDGPDLYTLLDQVVRRNCQQCGGFESCWRQNFYASYRELFDLLALAEMNGMVRSENLRGRLATACFQQRKLLEAVEAVLGGVQANQQARQQVAESKEFVAGQLEGVASIMTSLAREIQLDVEFRLEVEDRLKASFNRLGLSLASLSVLEYGQDMLEVRIKKHGCLNYFECQYLICPMVSRLLGHTFMVWEKQCPKDSQHDCSFVLVPAGKYQVRHAVGRIAKDQEYCGDSHALVQTKDGRLAILLSDGMGTGPKAARESKVTVDLLAQLLSAGLKEDFALNLINSVLMLRTPEERFATIDVALIDLFQGQLELIKVGAAPSYIKREHQLIPVRATTPPAGILQKIEVNREHHALAVGDYLILASDGVFAGALGPEKTEDWLERALARVEVAGPQPMVDFLLKIAQTNMGQEVMDDVTIIVAQLMPAGAL